MKISKLVSQLKAKIETIIKLVKLGIRKYIIKLVDLEAQLEAELAKLLTPQVLSIGEFKAVVLGSKGDKYTVNLKPGLLDTERCDCLDCYHRRRKCKHQVAVEKHLWMSINDYAIAKLAQSEDLDLFPVW